MSHSTNVAIRAQVYIVTGSNTGVGKELAQILFCRNAKVYIAARSETKARAAIESIRVACPASSGTLVFHHLVLDDLSAVAESAHEFLAKEGRLDVLFNIAGVMHPPQGSVTVQGYELQLGVHNLAPVLFTEMLTPLLEKTANALAQEGKKDLVRVVWVSSLYAEMGSPKGGFDPDNIDYGKKDQSKYFKYSASKAGVYYQGVEYGRRHAGKGIVSVVSRFQLNKTSDLQKGRAGWYALTEELVRTVTESRQSQVRSPAPCGQSQEASCRSDAIRSDQWGIHRTLRLAIT